MDLLRGLLDHPLIPYLIGAIALLFAYQKLAPRLRLPGLNVSPDQFLARILGPGFRSRTRLREVSRFKKQGNFLAAGKTLEEEGHMEEAAEAYLEGSEYWAAASNYEKLGKMERAAELYLQANDHKKAAQILSGIGKHAKAAALFQEKGNTLEAARLYGLAGDWAKAADIYSRSGYPLRAAEAFEKTGQHARAAECYEKHFMENVSFSTTYSSTAPSTDVKSAFHAGRLFEKAGELARAREAYYKGGYFKESAGVCMQLGLYAKAAELFLRAEDPQSAADAHDKAGDKVAAANLRGEVALRSEQIPEAAAFFQQGHDFLRAAELYESKGMLAEAAGAYEAGESWAAAGNVYVRAGLKARAAASYERARDYETSARLYEEAGLGRKAIELYEKAGFTFKSGESAARAGERDKAVALLQRVSPDDEHYRAASELLAQLFVESGKTSLAVERLQKTIAGAPVSSANLDLYYWLAVAREGAGNHREATEIYRKILSENVLYRDVEKRAAAIEQGQPLPLPAAFPPAGSAPAVVAPPAPAAKAGKAGRFVPREEIGSGPLGEVYRGEDQVDGRSVAMRLLRPELLSPEGVLAGLVADLKAASGISHPNLVKVLGVVEVQGRRCVVSELVSGRHFGEAVRGGLRMSVKQAHNLGRVVAQVLALVHEKGMVHGSLQPSNLMVAGGVVKVADLGLGRLAQRLPPGPEPDYRAPEGRWDAAGDLYALSAVLYHLMTGVHPKSQPQGVALPLPSSLAPGVPEAFDKLLLRGLHPRPEMRLLSAEAVLAELKDMVRFA
jgi:tetratricopeptide (TPR) repeat protein